MSAPAPAAPSCQSAGCGSAAVYTLDIARIGTGRAIRLMLCEAHGARVYKTALARLSVGTARELVRK